MEIIRKPLYEFGNAEFDKEYMNWGLHDKETQLKEAESLLRVVPSGRKLRMLDLACGIGIHAVYWASQGHEVTAVDISETFTNEGRKLAKGKGVDVTFEVGDIKALPYKGCFDVVTWLSKSFFNEEMEKAIYGFLAEGGLFITSSTNPDHSRTKQRTGDWRTWSVRDGVYILERHELDESDGLRHDEWIEINPATGQIVEKYNIYEHTVRSLEGMLQDVGFTTEFRTPAGEPFTGGPDEYRLWLVGRKQA